MPLSHWTVALPLALVLAALAVVGGLTAKGGRGGTLRREQRMGVRSEASLRSDQAFRVANLVSWPMVAGAAVIAGVCALVLIAVSTPVVTAILVFLLGALGATALLVQAARVGDQAARAVPRPARKPGGASCSGCACGGGGCAGLTRNAPSIAGSTGAVN